MSQLNDVLILRRRETSETWSMDAVNAEDLPALRRLVRKRVEELWDAGYLVELAIHAPVESWLYPYEELPAPPRAPIVDAMLDLFERTAGAAERRGK